MCVITEKNYMLYKIPGIQKTSWTTKSNINLLFLFFTTSPKFSTRVT